MQAQNTQHAFETYTDYIRSLLPTWPEYAWLYRQLSLLRPNNTSFLSIYNFQNGRVAVEDFVCTGAETADWWASRRSVPEDISARVILLSFPGSNANIVVLEKIALHYDVDPLFLWRHFDEVSDSVRKSFTEASTDRIRPPFAPLSQQKSFHFGFRLFQHASITICDGATLGYSGPPTGKSQSPPCKLKVWELISTQL